MDDFVHIGEEEKAAFIAGYLDPLSPTDVGKVEVAENINVNTTRHRGRDREEVEDAEGMELEISSGESLITEKRSLKDYSQPSCRKMEGKIKEKIEGPSNRKG